MSGTISLIDLEDRPPSSANRSLGDRGERAAVDHLIKNGFRIVMTNFTVPIGRNSKGVQKTGEIDIIALDGETLCFIEVKTRSSEEFTSALTAIDRQKQRQIVRTSKVYRRLFRIHGMECRFDAITVILSSKDRPKLTLYKAFWSETSLKKTNWNASQDVYFD